MESTLQAETTEALAQQKPYVLAPGEGRGLWHLGALLNFKALGEETAGQYWALEGLADREMKVPMHVHHRDEEMWLVLDGEITFHIGGEMTTGGPGTFVYIPRGTPHTFEVKSDTARWFGVGLPGGFDRWFFETGEPAQALKLPPTIPAEGPPNVDALVASLCQYATEVLGPPPNL